MKRALGTEYARNLLCRSAELAGKEETRAGGLGGLCDGHLRVDGEQADRGDDDVCAGERRGECGHVGVLGGRDAHAARSEGFVCLFVAGFLFFVDQLAPSGRSDAPGWRNGTYGSGDDGDFVNGSCGFLLEQLLDDEAADVACAYDGKLPEVGHDMGG